MLLKMAKWFIQCLFPKALHRKIEQRDKPGPAGTGRAQNAMANGGVALLFCPPFDVDTPPLGIAYLSAYLRSRSVPTLILDLNRELYDSAGENSRKLWNPVNSLLWHEKKYFEQVLRELGPRIDSAVARIVESGAVAVGFSIIYFNLMISLEIAARVRRVAPEIKIIVGGPETNCFDEGQYHPRTFFGTINSDRRYPLDLVDAFVIGDGEEALYEIMLRINSSSSLEGIPGVAVNMDGHFSQFKPVQCYNQLNYSRLHSAWQESNSRFPRKWGFSALQSPKMAKSNSNFGLQDNGSNSTF